MVVELNPAEAKRIGKKKLFAGKRKQSTNLVFLQTFGRRIKEFDSIKRAVESARKKTVENYYNELPNYFLFLNEDPDTVIANRRKDLNSEDTERYERRTRAYLRSCEEKGYSGMTILGYLSRIMGFFSNNSKRYSLDLKRLRISKARKKPKYSPTNEEIRHLLSFADSARDRLIILLMAQNGLVPIDISQIDIYTLPTEPWSYYEKSRSKTGEIWRGVITPDISRELKTMHKLNGKSNSINGRQGPLDSHAISQIVRNIIDNSGLGGIENFKPTSLRDAFEDSLVEANVNPKIKKALMGQTSDIEHQYGGHKRLVISIIEAMRKAYPFIATGSYIEESTQSKNDIEELKKRLEERDVELGRKIEEKNREIAELKAKFPETETLKTSLESLLKRVEEIETKLRANNSVF